MSLIYEKLDAMNSLKRGWNGYNAPPPTPLATVTARQVLDSFLTIGMLPKRLAPSAAGGVGITFKQAGRKAYVEVYNRGLVYVLFSDGLSDPIVRPVRGEHRGYDNLVAEVRQYLNA